MAPEQALHAKMRPPTTQHVSIVLQPGSHPELGEIHINEDLFAIGRMEAPFDAYPADIVADLSRRHARIFVEGGAAYLADLESKNGTTVNGVAVQHAITRLRDGDELGLGRALSYRVRLQAGLGEAPATARLISVTLRPDRSDLGLDAIVITRFPFLISKADQTFARYKDAQPQQVNYLSRRHAHIFLKGGRPYVEDLGSTNGTFIGAARLDERAVALQDEDLLAFGGHHFVYRVSLQWEQTAPDPTVTRVSVAPAAVDVDKTTFVAAADSFLEIFCVDRPPAQEDEVNRAEVPEQASATAEAGRAPGKFAVILSGLAEAVGASQADRRRVWRWGLALVALAAVLGIALYQSGAPERELTQLLARGDYGRAAALAGASLAQDPGNAELKAKGTEAVLKAEVPKWLAFMQARQFVRAAAVVAGMHSMSRNNAELLALVGELEWIGNLEQFVSARGGADVPAGSAADQARIRLVLKQWEDDAQQHQRAFATISAHVPAFRDVYAQALSHVRKLALTGGRGDSERQAP